MSGIAGEDSDAGSELQAGHAKQIRSEIMTPNAIDGADRHGELKVMPRPRIRAVAALDTAAKVALGKEARRTIDTCKAGAQPAGARSSRIGRRDRISARVDEERFAIRAKNFC